MTRSVAVEACRIMATPKFHALCQPSLFTPRGTSPNSLLHFHPLYRIAASSLDLRGNSGTVLSNGCGSPLASGVDVRRSVHARMERNKFRHQAAVRCRTVELTRGREAGAAILLYTPWHFLYFFPLPQGQGSLRPTLSSLR